MFNDFMYNKKNGSYLWMTLLSNRETFYNCEFYYSYISLQFPKTLVVDKENDFVSVTPKYD